jgi:hypothetical protein
MKHADVLQVSTIEQRRGDITCSQESDSPLTRYVVALVLINFAFGSLIAWSPWPVGLLRLMLGNGRPLDQQR